MTLFYIRLSDGLLTPGGADRISDRVLTEKPNWLARWFG